MAKSKHDELINAFYQQRAKVFHPDLQKICTERVVFHQEPHACGWHAKRGCYLFAVVNAAGGERCLYCMPLPALRDTEEQGLIDALCEEQGEYGLWYNAS